MLKEYQGRIAKLQMAMKEKGLSGSFIMDRVSLFYYFGTIPSGSGYIPVQSKPELFVRRGLPRAQAESPFTVNQIKSFRTIKSFFESRSWTAAGQIGLEFDRVPHNLFLLLQKYFPEAEFVDISGILKQQRAVKSEYELDILVEAGRRAARSFAQIPTLLQAKQVTELDAMAKFEAIMRQEGHQGLVRMHAFNAEIYYGVFASGISANANTAYDVPIGTPGRYPATPFLCSQKEIQVNEPIMVDLVFGYQGYMVDQTRIYVIGSLPQPLGDAFQCALTIQEQVVSLLKPGVSGAELYQKAHDIAQDWGLAENFMGFQENRVAFIGHGVGLELDELPLLAPGYQTPLLENMVIALEPKFFFTHLGGVGIENTFRVTATGGEKLTPFPDDLITIQQ
ncbi:M24 family metallopeptidase [candidate division CSSED10-310 bacterium]|uniref:M24 family metallopeptidase n=1 Tax=candidate division CSSED10-310 bacterium TaxID=2855610 RepID=A0ABV6Z1S7_UNCC1